MILSKAKQISKSLLEKGIETVLDDRAEYTPGWKFNEWELKGVPIRVEIGPRDVKQKQVTMARRDIFEKIAVKEEETVATVMRLLEEIQNNLFNRAKKFLQENIFTVKTYDEFKKVLKEKGGFIRASWCSNSKCEQEIKDETGATIRIVPFEKEKPFSKCMHCGGEAKEVVYFARAY